MRRRTATRRFLKVSVFPFRDEDYAFLGTIVLMEDVSRERSIDEYLLRTEKLASTAELAAGVAHEINNPLGIVQNYVELLKLRELDPDCAAEAGEDRERGEPHREDRRKPPLLLQVRRR